MKRRITTSDIARAAGVHQTTVSLALKNDPRLKPETIARLKAVAEKLGYAPDPMLTALAAYRRGRRPRKQHGTLAWLTNWPTRDGWRKMPMFLQFFEGAQRRATAMGYRLEEYWLNTPGTSLRRAAEILDARGVQGLILAPQPDGVVALDLDCTRFSVVTIGPTLRWPAYHMVSNHQFRTVTSLCEGLVERGYRRIGYAIERRIDDRMGGQWSAAFDRFQRDLPADRQLMRYEASPTLAGVRRWLRETQPDVVFSCDEDLASFLPRKARNRRPAVDFALIGMGHETVGCQGMYEDAERIGATAVERVTGLIQLGHRGVPEIATRMLLDATWVEPVRLGVSASREADVPPPLRKPRRR